MPTRSKRRILAIDPGTRYMGVALLDGGKLVYHGVKTLRHRGSPHERLREGRAAVLTMIADFKPQILAVETAFFANNRNTALLNVLVDEIRAIGRMKGLRVAAYAPTTVKKRIAGDGRAAKHEVARAVAARFPELQVYLSQDREWQARYHGNMFDAVALALVAITPAGTAGLPRAG